MCCNELCTLSSCLPASSLKFICSPLHFVLCRLYNSHIMTLYKYMGSVSVKMFQDRRITDFELRLYILYAGKTWILYAAKYCLIVISHCLMYISRVACYTHLTLYTSVIENISVFAFHCHGKATLAKYKHISMPIALAFTWKLLFFQT